MTKIGLLSDVHATPGPVAEALSIFRQAGVEQVLCAGDIAGYRQELDETVGLLTGSGCQAVAGNHDLQYLDHYEDETDTASAAFLRQLPASIELTIAGKRLYMVHAHPPDACHGGIKLLNRAGEVRPDRLAHWAAELETFDCDVLVVGHTHQVFAQSIGNTLVVNPGSSAFNHSCAILALPEMTVQMFPLSGKSIDKCWNWADHVIGMEQHIAPGAGLPQEDPAYDWWSTWPHRTSGYLWERRLTAVINRMTRDWLWERRLAAIETLR